MNSTPFFIDWMYAINNNIKFLKIHNFGEQFLLIDFLNNFKEYIIINFFESGNFQIYLILIFGPRTKIQTCNVTKFIVTLYTSKALLRHYTIILKYLTWSFTVFVAFVIVLSIQSVDQLSQSSRHIAILDNSIVADVGQVNRVPNFSLRSVIPDCAFCEQEMSRIRLHRSSSVSLCTRKPELLAKLAKILNAEHFFFSLKVLWL